ncbi:MAG: aconitate hydratase AcnA [Firmicutes bacterium]|nr:aconitate hydratase AcnA [Bacillota bacterium]
MREPQPGSFGAAAEETFDGCTYHLWRLEALQSVNREWARLPYTVQVFLESLLRREDGRTVTADDIENLAQWPAGKSRPLAFYPARVLLQDFTGVPVIVDLTALRSVVAEAGGNPMEVTPKVPVDLVIDHSVQVDRWADPSALQFNVDREFERNHERYGLLKWAEKHFPGLRVVPPGRGIVHQVNLEYLTPIVQEVDGALYPDSVIGTDSHTTMVNGAGVVAWGVGGIEAEAAMLGLPLDIGWPQIVAFELEGSLNPGVTATDLVLTITEKLRQHGVIGKFVEVIGPGVQHLTVPERATVSNMAPEYGATAVVFPPDFQTIKYLKQTGRPPEDVRRVEWYFRRQQMWVDSNVTRIYSETVRLDLSTIVPSIAGPKNPQERISLSEADVAVRGTLAQYPQEQTAATEVVYADGQREPLDAGAVVIAAITSCTNTSNPYVMSAAGLLARNAVARGLRPPRYVKTSMAPGSRVVTTYLQEANLLASLEVLGFAVVGYGCTTCIGNSGPLTAEVSQAVQTQDLPVAAVLSGNRNFEGRIHAQTRLNYLMSPPLVVAYALAGTMQINLLRDPLGRDSEGQPVYLADLWPPAAEVADVVNRHVQPAWFRERYANAFTGGDSWQAVDVPQSDQYRWSLESSYIQRPSFVKADRPFPKASRPARILGIFGDAITTDHISPAGAIALNSPAGQYLMKLGVDPKDFNSYGSRRGNHEVMVRGTFANARLRNQMVEREGGYTRHQPDGSEMTIYDAAMQYRNDGVPLIVLAGDRYGSGSSRDWAAKGTLLLGVQAVLAQSFERIHRSNLIGMGILPLEFLPGESWTTWGIGGDEELEWGKLPDPPQTGEIQRLSVTIIDRMHGRTFHEATVRLDTAGEWALYHRGGIFPSVVATLLS